MFVKYVDTFDMSSDILSGNVCAYIGECYVTTFRSYFGANAIPVSLQRIQRRIDLPE